MINEEIETSRLVPLRFTTDWKDLEVVSEVDVIETYKGYVPVLQVFVAGIRTPKLLIISAKSISEQLTLMRADNANCFKGLKFSLRKASSEKTAPYEFK